MNRLFWGFLLVLAALLVWWAWPKGGGRSGEATSSRPAPLGQGPKVTYVVNPSAQSSEAARVPANTLPPQDISVSMVSAVKRVGDTPVLVLQDGSQLTVDAATYSQLPAQVRLLLDYKRSDR